MKKFIAGLLIQILSSLLAYQASAQDSLFLNCSLLVNVIDDEGKPIIAAAVSVLQDSSTITSSYTDVNGTVTFSLDTGSYLIKSTYLQNEEIILAHLSMGINQRTITISTSNELQAVMIESRRADVIEDGYGGQSSLSEGAGLVKTRHLSQSMSQIGGVTRLNGRKLSIRGSRNSNTTTIIDGRVISGSNPQSSTYVAEKPFLANADGEGYAHVQENPFKQPRLEPLSTFSIDVDGASYTNARRFINNGQIPPAEAIRVEEFVNYFDYQYAKPTGEHPFAVHTELAISPWDPAKYLVQIALQGAAIELEQAKASNLVFLIDVSGSMSSPDKLGLVKKSLQFLIDRLRPEDKISMVVYAGASGLVLDATSGSDKEKIKSALYQLESGGSTAGGAGIELAYRVAKEHFIAGGNNRVILATDGDFNVGVSSAGGLEKLIEEKRKTGVFLTTLGFGMGNYQDSKMEILANKGNGNYYYIDGIQEAEKVFGADLMGTLFTIAKDVKIQVEFNPAHVQAYRLIGYENRMLAAEDFNDDSKDAGELGSGHTVTALYEIIPAGAVLASELNEAVDPLRYQKLFVPTEGTDNSELLTVKLRYKLPDGEESILLSTHLENKAVAISECSVDMQFSAAVAAFALCMAKSEHLNDYGMENTIALAKSAKGEDENGYRAECIQLMKLYSKMEKLN